jgi:hypothetical protein
VERDSELCTNIQVPEFKHDPRSVGIIFITEGRGQVRGGFQIVLESVADPKVALGQLSHVVGFLSLTSLFCSDAATAAWSHEKNVQIGINGIKKLVNHLKCSDAFSLFKYFSVQFFKKRFLVWCWLLFFRGK